ncbi:hypothetical protein Tsubulata_016058 [Turnera subulata]|uniref:CCT domain-containing protein n=1 Tax=Turnera subulata TaxID=218843 RepID=A0A9Q0FKJ6_9ROSI|nr:hypothetical protein Tsubulata_016058 [Turnera subulata]
MSAPCLSGGTRTYGFDLEIAKSPSTSRTSHSSSPSSTLSESSNSPLAISTRKSRTPRKRPNQTYNEAAALLSTAYPSIFSTKHLTKNPCKKFTTKPHDTLLLDEPPELLLPFRVFDNSGFPLPQQQPIREKPSFLYEPKVESLMMSSGEVSSLENNSMGGGGESVYLEEEDFDAESILDEEIEEGIDSIMGNLCVRNEVVGESNNNNGQFSSSWYGNPMGLQFNGGGIGIRRGVRALRHHVDDGNWWHFPIVDMLQISPRLLHQNNNHTSSTTSTNTQERANGNSNSNPRPKLKSNPSEKKKKKVEKPPPAAAALESKKLAELAAEEENSSIPESSPPGLLLLKLNYEDVLSAWSDRASPFPEESPGSEGNDVSARLAQIDLFSENGGLREASVLRYKEKRRTRLFSKKIRYQVRKVNADRRPRMKGRFVRRPNSSNAEEKSKKSSRS